LSISIKLWIESGLKLVQVYINHPLKNAAVKRKEGR